MSEKRRNWLILGVVVALMIGCGVLMTQRSFRLGLDLRGGLEVVLDARPLPGQTVSQQDLNTSVTILSKRIDPNGTLNPEIRSSTNPDQITIAIPGVRDPAAVASLLVSSGQLQSFDMFKYLNDVSKGTQPYTALPADSLYSLLTKPAVKAQAKSDGVGSWALFDANHKQLGKVEPQQSQVLEDYKPQNPVKPPGAQFLGIPKGTEVVSCDASTGCPGATATTGTFYYLFNLNQNEQGNPNVITGDQVSASSDTDPNTGQPIVTLSYKNGGGAEFTNISRSLAQQARAAGMADGQINPPKGLPNAIVVDGQLVATPVVDPDENPNGINATFSGSSVISGLTKATPTGSRSRCSRARCRSSSRPPPSTTSRPRSARTRCATA